MADLLWNSAQIRWDDDEYFLTVKHNLSYRLLRAFTAEWERVLRGAYGGAAISVAGEASEPMGDVEVVSEDLLNFDGGFLRSSAVEALETVTVELKREMEEESALATQILTAFRAQT